MYSVILLAAMTTPADTPALGRLFKGGCGGCVGTACAGCSGCAGCAGVARGGCAGSACSGGAGYAYGSGYVHDSGIYAGSSWGGYSCGGCGGCGGRFLGFRSGCWGDGGYRVSYACHGSGACYGYAYAGISYGFAGCYGSCYGSYTNYFSYWPVAVNAQPFVVGNATNAPRASNTPTPASVIVTLPADAKLFANGQPTKQTSGERRFVTPELQPGRAYRYTLSAEITRDDRPLTETIEVDVHPGAESRVSFAKLIAATKVEPTRVASK